MDDLSKNFEKSVTVSEEDSEEVFVDAASVSDSAVTDFEDSDYGTKMPPAPSFKSVLIQLITKFASSSGTDLFSMSSPAIVCNGISVLEYCAHYCDHPEFLAAIAKGQEPVDRLLFVVQWFISGLFGSYASRSTSTGFERKPFNPILGERFFARWKDEGDGECTMTAEQVSHHPPTTAFYLANEKAGVFVNAFSAQKTRLQPPSIRVEQQGNVFVYLREHEEEYMITMPQLYVRGLMTGATFLEICGDVSIVSSSGFGAKMRFIPKPWFNGEYDQVEAVLFDTKSGKIHFDVWGKWSGTVYFAENDQNDKRRCHFKKTADPASGTLSPRSASSASTTSLSSGSSSSSSSSTYENVSSRSNVGDNPNVSLVGNLVGKKGAILFDPEMFPKIPFTVEPIAKQGPMESRRVWHSVAKALKASAWETANAAKDAIENEQRALRAQRAQKNETWVPEFFDFKEFCFLPSATNDGNAEHLNEVLLNVLKGDAVGSAASPLSGRIPYKGRWINKEFSKKF
jgi:hypothetical protein